MEGKIFAFLKRHNIDLKNKKAVIAVSTGVDSMTILDLFIKMDLCEIIVAHVNHGKRSESQEEEAFIKEFCNKHEIKIYVTMLPEIKGNFQEGARAFRHKFFNEVIEKEKADYLVLGHHLDDDIETMLMRIIRGSNLIGYAGINEYIDMGSYATLRPLLKVLKKEIIEYANLHNIKYYEDYTNKEDKYTRNKIRHNIIPEMLKINNNLYEKLIEFKENIVAVSKTSEEIRDKFISENVHMTKESFSFKVKAFNKLADYYKIEVLFELLKAHQYSKANILEIIKLINTKKKNLKIIYKESTFVKEYNDITIFYYPKKDEVIDVLIDDIGEYQIDENRKIIVTKKNDIRVTNLYKIWYNSRYLPLVARTKLPGDRIAFSYGHKKVNKFMIDEKVKLQDRDKAILLEKDGDVLAILGYAKSAKLQNISDCDIIIELKEKYNEDSSSIH